MRGSGETKRKCVMRVHFFFSKACRLEGNSMVAAAGALSEVARTVVVDEAAPLCVYEARPWMRRALYFLCASRGLAGELFRALPTWTEKDEEKSEAKQSDCSVRHKLHYAVLARVAPVWNAWQADVTAITSFPWRYAFRVLLLTCFSCSRLLDARFTARVFPARRCRTSARLRRGSRPRRRRSLT